MERTANLDIPDSGPWAGTAFDIFKGHWAYEIPVKGTSTGTMRTFDIEPPALTILKEYFPDYRGCDVLELCPHEGEQSFHLSKSGVGEVYAIEGEPVNFLKCLIVKNELKLHNVTFAVGDFVKYLEDSKRIWDIIYCSGVLHHMKNPAKLIELLAKRGRRVIIRTIVFDRESMQQVDEGTERDQFATFWLKDIDPSGYRFRSESGDYVYYCRKFVDGEFNAIMRRCSSYEFEANLVDADTLLKMLINVGGSIRYWSSATGSREPMAHAAVYFEHGS